MSSENKTKTVKISCIIEWAKVFEANRDKTGPNGVWEDHGGATTVDMLMDDANYKTWCDSGAQQRDKKGEDAPLHRVKIKRKWVDRFPNWGGEPAVVHASGKPWDIAIDGLIGNGSKAIVFVDVYEAKGLVGSRLGAVQVLEHVSYESEGSYGYSFENLSGDEPSPSKEPANKEFADDLPF